MSVGNGISAITSSIGASISASITENRPSVNSSRGRDPGSCSPASSQKRARISAVTVSSVGLSSTLASTVSVAHRLRFSTPSSASAWPIELISKRRPKNAELT